MIPFSDPGGSTTDQKLPTNPKRNPRHFHQPKRWGVSSLTPLPIWGPRASPEPPTFGVIPVDSFPDQGLPLPEGGPQEVVGPTADLDHLPGGVHQGPRGAFRVGVADVLSVPHLEARAGHSTRISTSVHSQVAHGGLRCTHTSDGVYFPPNPPLMVELITAMW